MIALKEMPPVLREGIPKNVNGLRNVTAKEIPCSLWSTKEMRPNNPPSLPHELAHDLESGLVVDVRRVLDASEHIRSRQSTPPRESWVKGEGTH